jgi:exoribonuclease R
MYSLQIEDRNYSKWTIKTLPSDAPRPGPIGLPENFHPLNHKLFHEDVFEILQPNTICISSSPFLENQSMCIPAILILSDGKTYGRTENKKKLLYRCIPNNKHLPIFLVPYEITLELSKHIVNKYVLIKYKNWDEKHPRGELVETIGNINNYQAFENYQLYCKGLQISLSYFTKHLKTKCQITSESDYIESISKKYSVKDRRLEYVFSIDNMDTTDYDDAMSITEIDDKIRVSIYIANVMVWLEELGGWNAFSDRVSTIYLPSKKYPMIPSLLSENYCSLMEKRKRFAIAVDFTIYPDGFITTEFRNTIITVKRNFRYEEEKLLKNEKYKQLFSISQGLDRTIKDSHDLVAYWMIKTNEAVGEQLFSNKLGIFRKTNTDNIDSIESVDHNMSTLERTLFHIQNNIHSEYKEFAENATFVHSAMNTYNYLHFTSPIRRLVDLLNQIYLWKIMGYDLSDSMCLFLESWINKIGYINTQMKSIRKTQSNCDLLYMVTTNPTIIDKIFSGIIINKKYSDNENIITYSVYFESLKYIANIVSECSFKIHQTINCKIFVFNDKDTIQQKVIIQPIE